MFKLVKQREERGEQGKRGVLYSYFVLTKITRCVR